MADDSVSKKRNPLKIMLIIVIVLLIVVVLLQLKNEKIMLEDEQGNTYTGASGKFLKSPDSED